MSASRPGTTRPSTGCRTISPWSKPWTSSRPIVDDPFDYGAIAAANALSDVYAVGGRPISALNVAAFPRDLPLEIFASVLAGGMDKATEAGCAIVGGHTVDDREPKYGLAVTGLVEPGKQVSNAGAQAGDRLVLTKAIGTGVITTGHKNDKTAAGPLAEAVKSMKTLNRGASEAMTAAGANAATDVTGFGLLGHLHSMMKASGTSARISRSASTRPPGSRGTTRARRGAGWDPPQRRVP